MADHDRENLHSHHEFGVPHRVHICDDEQDNRHVACSRLRSYPGADSSNLELRLHPSICTESCWTEKLEDQDAWVQPQGTAVLGEPLQDR